MSEKEEPVSCVIGAEPMVANMGDSTEGVSQEQVGHRRIIFQMPPAIHCPICRQNQWFSTEYNEPLAQLWVRCPMCLNWVAPLQDIPFETKEVDEG